MQEDYKEIIENNRKNYLSNLKKHFDREKTRLMLKYSSLDFSEISFDKLAKRSEVIRFKLNYVNLSVTRGRNAKLSFDKQDIDINFLFNFKNIEEFLKEDIFKTKLFRYAQLYSDIDLHYTRLEYQINKIKKDNKESIYCDIVNQKINSGDESKIAFSNIYYSKLYSSKINFKERIQSAFKTYTNEPNNIVLYSKVNLSFKISKNKIEHYLDINGHSHYIGWTQIKFFSNDIIKLLIRYDDNIDRKIKLMHYGAIHG